MAAHTGVNRHAFLDEDEEGNLTRVRVNLGLLIDRVTPGDQPLGTPVGQKRIDLVSDGRLSEEALNHTHPQRASALLIQAIGEDNSPRCTKCTPRTGSGPDRLNWVFWDCRSHDWAQGGACGSCVWRQDASGCSLRRFISVRNRSIANL